MKSQFKHIALIGKFQALGIKSVLSEIAHFLSDSGAEVSLEEQTAANTGLGDWSALSLTEVGRQCDLAVVVGGDGTMLGVARDLARAQVPLIGINQGRLGFITDIPIQTYPALLRPMLEGQFDEDRRSLLEGCVYRDGSKIFEASALNDVVVSRGSTSGMVELRVSVDGHFLANQRADGLILASPTGSTAYSLSAGGPILHPAIDGWVMVPIAPHTLTNRPIVLPNDSEISIELVAGRDASANFDTHSLASLIHGDRISVHRSRHQARFLHPRGWTYFDTLRKKLHWNEGVGAGAQTHWGGS